MSLFALFASFAAALWGVIATRDIISGLMTFFAAGITLVCICYGYRAHCKKRELSKDTVDIPLADVSPRVRNHCLSPEDDA